MSQSNVSKSDCTDVLSAAFYQEVARGDRFRFGDNWRAFLSVLNEERIAKAKLSLQSILETDSLAEKTFVDVGSGSGLFSLAARRLGARVHSFDYDPSSVWCTRELRRRYLPDDAGWIIEHGSVLDEGYIRSLGQFDVVYSFGVLHHTGDMWKALDLVVTLVKPKGKLFIAIYNDRGNRSRLWRLVKKTYCRTPGLLKPLIVIPFAILLCWRPIVSGLMRLRSWNSWFSAGDRRGMSWWRDLIDWLGGYPFEVAQPKAIFDFYRQRGFALCQLNTDGGSGTNHFVFERKA